MCLACILWGASCTTEFKPPGFGSDAEVTARRSWSIRVVAGEFSRPQAAIDGMGFTAATTRRSYRNATLVLDLGRECWFNTIVLLHGQREYGYAKRVAVATSRDGRNFTHVANFLGTRRFTYLPLMTPVSARYIRLTAVEPGPEPWNLAEIYIQ